MLTYDLIVIGFGKAGKTLAGKLASAGKKVALVERSKGYVRWNLYQHWLYPN
ncbi:FAD binding domain protein [Streptococcus pneumoniae NP141]|nr:FAD binding domain protein [Streptococcus pneumoniae NP141]